MDILVVVITIFLQVDYSKLTQLRFAFFLWPLDQPDHSNIRTFKVTLHLWCKLHLPLRGYLRFQRSFGHLDLLAVLSHSRFVRIVMILDPCLDTSIWWQRLFRNLYLPVVLSHRRVVIAVMILDLCMDAIIKWQRLFGILDLPLFLRVVSIVMILDAFLYASLWWHKGRTLAVWLDGSIASFSAFYNWIAHLDLLDCLIKLLKASVVGRLRIY